MSYEWDEQKRQVNLKKHGVDFIDVEELFDGNEQIYYFKQISD